MIQTASNRFIRCVNTVFLTLLLFLPAGAVYPGGLAEFTLFADMLSLQAEQVALQDILKRFADHGTRVRIDPDINPSISAAFKNRELQKALDTILKSLDHALVWESIPGPGGSLPFLAEIQVYRAGHRSDMRALEKYAVLSLDPHPETGWLFVKDELLVRLADGVGSADFQQILSRIGGRVTAHDPATGVYRIRLPDGSDVPALTDNLLKHPKIAAAEPNYAYPICRPYPVTTPEAPSLPSTSLPEGADKAVPVAVFDTGLMANAELERLVLASLDTLQPGNPITDTQGHGTQMALIASGLVTPLGVDSRTDSHFPLIPIRMIDDNGFTSGFQLMQGIDFAIRNGARVLSLSWGSDTRSRFLETALDNAASRGLIIVASAGNEPTGRPVYPAAYPAVIGVGALGPDGNVWEQSNTGSFISLYAPGFASLQVGYRGAPGGYAGTSIAAAYAANRIAAYLTRHPQAGIQEIFAALQSSANP